MVTDLLLALSVATRRIAAPTSSDGVTGSP
jgi:hypothetical protein